MCIVSEFIVPQARQLDTLYGCLTPERPWMRGRRGLKWFLAGRKLTVGICCIECGNDWSSEDCCNIGYHSKLISNSKIEKWYLPKTHWLPIISNFCTKHSMPCSVQNCKKIGWLKWINVMDEGDFTRFELKSRKFLLFSAWTSLWEYIPVIGDLRCRKAHITVKKSSSHRQTIGCIFWTL